MLPYISFFKSCDATQSHVCQFLHYRSALYPPFDLLESNKITTRVSGKRSAIRLASPHSLEHLESPAHGHIAKRLPVQPWDPSFQHLRWWRKFRFWTFFQWENPVVMTSHCLLCSRLSLLLKPFESRLPLAFLQKDRECHNWFCSGIGWHEHTWRGRALWEGGVSALCPDNPYPLNKGSEDSPPSSFRMAGLQKYCKRSGFRLSTSSSAEESSAACLRETGHQGI